MAAAKKTKTPNPSKTGLSDEKLISMWADMARIRRFEERCGQVYAMGQIGGFCHLYIGQEAVVVGLQAVTQAGDQTITGYRDHAHMLACGMEPGRVMAELTGRMEGYSKGKGGSMHMFSVEKNFYGGHGIVGAQVPLGTGLAFANKYRGNDNIAFVYFGDGAANQGQVYESFNMAKLWTLPCLYIIENNRYAMGTSDHAPFDQDFHLILNLAMGGNYTGGTIDNSAFGTDGHKMLVDYVRVYQCGAGANACRSR